MSQAAPVTLKTPPPKNPTVALFITCLTDQFYPRVGIAVTKILEKLGCRVEFPPAQTCCGQPFFNNGFESEARELARRMAHVFATYDHVVTPSGSCCAMVREHFHDLVADDPAVAKLAANTFEFVEFLDTVLKVDFSALKLPQPLALTYHYTCHLRGLGIHGQAEKILQQIGNINFRPMQKADQCCGFGGTFAIKYPAISGAIVEDKTRCIAATGATALVCNDAGCTMNISGMCHRQGMPTQFVHLAELIAQAMGLDLTDW
jgi:L-lactate dehydrogenase complex protein LldE